MKIRTGFVSNSSSSSFVCDVCGESVGGWDLSLSEAEMCECINNHTICQEHSDQERISAAEEAAEEADEDCDFIYELPAELCPCCSFENVATSDLVAFLLMWAGSTREQVAEKMRTTYGSYEEFKAGTKGLTS